MRGEALSDEKVDGDRRVALAAAEIGGGDFLAGAGLVAFGFEGGDTFGELFGGLFGGGCAGLAGVGEVAGPLGQPSCRRQAYCGRMVNTPAPHHDCGVLLISMTVPSSGSIETIWPPEFNAKMMSCQPARP